MTFVEFAKYIRKQSGTNAATFTDADLLSYANIYKDELARRIVRCKQDYFGMPETANLAVNGDGSPQREYPLPSDAFRQVKYVEAKLDGVKWTPLEELDLTSFRSTTDEATIAATFGNTRGNAKYDLFRGSIWLYTATFGAVVNGLKLWTFQWPAKFTDLTSTTDMSIDPDTSSVGFPREFHELLARRVIIARKSEGDKPMQLTDNEKKYDADLQIALDEITVQGPIYAKLPTEDSWDNGYNL